MGFEHVFEGMDVLVDNMLGRCLKALKRRNAIQYEWDKQTKHADIESEFKSQHMSQWRWVRHECWSLKGWHHKLHVKSRRRRTGRRDVQLVSKVWIADWWAWEIPSKIRDCGVWTPRQAQLMPLITETPQEKARSIAKMIFFRYLTRAATVSYKQSKPTLKKTK